MSYKEEIGLFLDVAGTPSTTLDIADFCETDDPDGLIPSQPLSLRHNWRQLIADRIVDDILQDHVAQATIKAILDINTFVLFSRDRNGEEALCGRPTGFRRKMTSSIAANTTFRVAVRLPSATMTALSLRPRQNLAAPNQLNFRSAPAQDIPDQSLLVHNPPPAPNKLDINKDIDMKQFRVTEFQSLARLVDIQRWYNAVHSRGRVCGIYTSPWEAFNKDSHMGTMWSNYHLDQAILDRQDIMSAALHSLLSSKGIFKGDCEDFTHLVSQSKGNGYLALYQIVRMVHPVLGQVTTQPSQPSQKKTQSFSEHVSNYVDYFQSESCSGRKYSPYEQVALILSRLHPIWKDVMQRRYKQLVPHGGPNQIIPMECNL